MGTESARTQASALTPSFASGPGYPSSEGWMSTPIVRSSGGDEPPRHSRPRRCSHGPSRYRRGLRQLRRTGSAASDKPDSAANQRNRAGAEHANGTHRHLAGKEPQVHIPVALV